jgi:hypothetical protein
VDPVERDPDAVPSVAPRQVASFRLFGDALDPATASTVIGLAPSHSHRKGEQKRTRTGRRLDVSWRVGMWILSTDGHVDRRENPLEEHLTLLLDQLAPRAEAISRLMQEHSFEADFFCGFWLSKWNDGFEVSPRILERIASLGAVLSLDIYAPDEDRSEAEAG